MLVVPCDLLIAVAELAFPPDLNIQLICVHDKYEKLSP